MITLGHDDMGCGCAQLFGMPARGYSRKPNETSKPLTDSEYKEKFLNSWLKHRMPFHLNHNSNFLTDDFSFNGKSRGGDRIPHFRTVREWLFEYWQRPMSLIILGQSQNNDGLGKILPEIGFKLQGEFPNPIMSWQPVYMYTFPPVSKSEYMPLQQKWQAKLKAERDDMAARGIIDADTNGSHNGGYIY